MGLTPVERARLWRKNNLERHRTYSRKYYHDHKKQQLLKRAAYQKEHMEAHNQASKKWNNKNPEYKRFYHHLRRYGITPDDYRRLLENQNGRCAICGALENGFGRNERLHIDHCHQTNTVRGLLCGNCNIMLGGAKDTAQTLILGAAYLEKAIKCQSEAA